MATISSAEYEARIKALEKLNTTLSIEVDVQRQREQALSNAYLRLRRLIGQRAFDTPYGPTGEQVWATTEAALTALIAEVDQMRPVVEATVRQVNRDDDRFSWYDLKQAVNTYEASKGA